MENKTDKETDMKVYDLAWNEHQRKEESRDTINTYYTTLFAAIVSIMPFINEIAGNISSKNQGYIVRLCLILLSSVGLTLAISWAVNLKRTAHYLEILNKLIRDIEKRHAIFFVTYLAEQLEGRNAHAKVTKYNILIPYTFIAVFASVIIYSVAWLIE